MDVYDPTCKSTGYTSTGAVDVHEPICKSNL